MPKRAFVFLFALILTLSFVFGACTPESGESSSVSDNSSAVESSSEPSEASDTSIPFDDETSDVSDNSTSDESVEEITIDSKYAEAYERDRKIYTDYLLNTKYKDLGAFDENVTEEFEISSRMIDLDGDGVFELLIKTYSFLCGFRTSLLTLKDGKVSVAVSADDGGGSMGGCNLYLVTDTKNDCYAVKMASFFRDRSANWYYHEFYTLDTYFESPDVKTGHDFYDKRWGDYDETIEEIKGETDLYKETDDAFYTYSLGEKYVRDTEWSEAETRFINIDYVEYAFYKTTYNDPILSFEGRFEYVDEEY